MSNHKIMDKEKLGIYVHIPFCVKKCPYCGFYSIPIGGIDNVNQSVIEGYICRLNADIKRFSGQYSEGRIVDSIFYGGGTPTSIDVDSIIVTLDNIKNCFDVSADCEITIESNPGTFIGTDTSLAKLKVAGFNRLSIGVQSFDDEVLKTLGRIHSASEAEETFRFAREAGFENINLDLMFGIPRQTMESWAQTLDKAFSLAPEHLSFYSLQIEERTAYWKLFNEGKLSELPDELNRYMYHSAIEMIKSAGYKHYEISNASRPGFECRHNIKYWTLSEYLGIGASASSYMEGRRFTFIGDTKAYVGASAEPGSVPHRAEPGSAPHQAELDGTPHAEDRLAENHVNSDFDDMSEYTFTGLRMTKGINYGEFHARFGVAFRDAFRDRWDELKEFFDGGYIREYVDQEGRPTFLALTEKGIDVSNRIMAIFV